MKLLKYLIFIAVVSVQNLGAQMYVLDSVKREYSQLIDEKANTLFNVENSPAFRDFLLKLDSIFEGKRERLHIFHIGGSHIQADFYSNKLRTYLQDMNEISTSQRGFVFPYHLAHTNNPLNYRIEANPENWKGYRCSVGRDSVPWGLSGVTAVLQGDKDTVNVRSNYRNYNREPYCFDKLRLFYDAPENGYNVKIDPSWVIGDTINTRARYREFTFKYPMDEVEIVISRNDTEAQHDPFYLMGVELMNDRPGVEYTSIGANGAKFDSYERCVLFEEQLRLYTPDLFIISMGTNDAYTANFNARKYKAQYKSFIEMVRRVNPNCAILLTVPNDSFYKRKYPNRNTMQQQQIIMELSKENDLVVWDLFSVMGGLGSSQHWYDHGLMAGDRIHFTLEGYSLKADLLLAALVEKWEEYTQRPEQSLLTYFKSFGE